MDTQCWLKVTEEEDDDEEEGEVDDDEAEEEVLLTERAPFSNPRLLYHQDENKQSVSTVLMSKTTQTQRNHRPEWNNGQHYLKGPGANHIQAGSDSTE